jgi:hypothetical protein
MVKSINQNTNIEKGAVVILLICTYTIKNTLRNIAYKYPPIYLLFPSVARSYDMEHITQGGNSAQVLAVLNLILDTVEKLQENRSGALTCLL